MRVQPRAQRTAIAGEIGDALKISLTAPPVDGRANQTCIDFLAELLDIPRSSITIISGQTSGNKIVRVQGISAAEVRNKLGSTR